MSYSLGDVIVIRFPFTDQQRTKQRADVIFLALTSQTKDDPDFGEARVQDWRSAGLLKPSLFKPIVFKQSKRLDD